MKARQQRTEPTKRLKRISHFLTDLGFTLRNQRWSWGAYSDREALLITWEDELDKTRRFVRVLLGKSNERPSLGLNERIDHLRMLWSGGLAGYAVVATAKDEHAQPRKIKSYDSENVRAIVSLVAEPDGSIWAELGEEVPIQKLKKHAASHRLFPGEGSFPIARTPSKAFKPTPASYVAKLPAMRKWLIEVARRGETVTYGEARLPFGLRTLEHRHALDRIGHACVDAGEPILTSLIVDEVTGRCGAGFDRAFRRDDVEERQDCYAFWSLTCATPAAPQGGRKAATTIPDSTRPGEALNTRAARFAKTAVRPEQAAFRRRVFLEYRGACLVTGCTVPEALDAAHRHGRDWRVGHNSGADGLLLRKDVHALYDAGLIRIDKRGSVKFNRDVEPHYRAYLRKSS